MERAGNEELTEDTEKKGLGTPATRAAIIEKLIQSGFVKREKKNLVPTDDGNVLITVLPDEIKSPKMTAEWEMALNHIAQISSSGSSFSIFTPKNCFNLFSIALNPSCFVFFAVR